MDDKRQIILVGKAGKGKSSTGNSILQRKHFKAEHLMSAVTTNCRQKCAFRCDAGRAYEVVDTPGLFDMEMPLAKRALEVQMALDYCLEPHAFLLVLSSADRFTAHEVQTIRLLDIIFGDSFMEHVIIVYTRGDDFDTDDDFDKFVKSSESFEKVMGMCGNRVRRIENKNAGSEKLLLDLLNLIETLSENGKKRYMPDAKEARRDELHTHIDKNLSMETQHELEYLEKIIEERKKREASEKEWKNLKMVGKGLACVAVAGAAVGVAVSARPSVGAVVAAASESGVTVLMTGLKIPRLV